MAKVLVQELSDGLLDWAVSMAAGLPTRGPRAAREEEIERLATPFTLYEVGGAPARVREITVTRRSRGDDFLSPPGCILDGLALHYVDEDGTEGRGNPESFYLDRAEAELALFEHENGAVCDFRPTQDWSQAGPFIEQVIEHEGLRAHRWVTGEWWAASEAPPARAVSGPTLLTAAMRRFVISKLGEQIDIPDEILAPHRAMQGNHEPPSRARPRG